MTTGPVEERLAGLIDACQGWEDVAWRGLHAVGPPVGSREPLGDFKLNLREATRSSVDDECERIAVALDALDVVERALPKAPYVYLTLDASFVAETVIEAVAREGDSYGTGPATGRRVLVSYSNPNLNKPLHLGHLRNNLLGAALAELLAARGDDVTRAQVVSDWGRHICQAAVAYAKWGDDEAPESVGAKSDHFVGRHYVRFHEENAGLSAASYGDAGNDGDGAGDDPAKATTSVLDDEAAAMLVALEAGDPDAAERNRRIVAWAEAGIEATYRRIGTRFDVVFRESEARPLARRLIDAALAQGTCLRRSDGSIYADLTAQNLGEVTLVRRDGTLVAYSQLLGSYVERFERCRFDTAVIVNGQQWSSGFAVIDTLLRLLGYDWVDRHDRVHYGMVRLAEGAMASRTGLAVHVDGFLDGIADELRRRLPPRVVASLPANDIEALAVAFVKLTFLRVPQAKPLHFDAKALWEAPYECLSLVVRGLATAEARGAATVANGGHGSSKRLSLLVNALPALTQRAAEHRDPSKLTRHLLDLCAAVLAEAPHIPDDDGIRAAAATAIRRSLALLNVSLPRDLNVVITPADPCEPARSSAVTPLPEGAPVNLSASPIVVDAVELDLDALLREAPSVHEAITALTAVPVDPDPYLEAAPSTWQALLRRVDGLVERGLVDGDRAAALDFHRTLHALFRLATTAHVNDRELSWHLAGLRARMAKQWIAIEADRYACEPVAPMAAHEVEPWFRRLVADNPAVDHPLYAFLEKEGDVDHFRYFMRQEASVDADFVDLLALTQLGFGELSKAELARNYWDEMGNGDSTWEHARMFAESLTGLGVGDLGDDVLSLESLVCGNLLWATSFYRCYHRLSIGALGALETASPTRFQRLADAAKRLGLAEVVFNYYDMHVEADQSHSTGWVRNVVLPMVTADPAAAADIAVGVALRLGTSSRYCDAVYATLLARSPAEGAADERAVLSW